MPKNENPTNTERRFLGGNLRIKRRAKGDGEGDQGETDCICGYAIVYNTWTTLYESKSYRWREIIRPGAASNALKEKQDVRCLFNHDRNIILGRTASGTLRLAETDQGLAIDCDAPETQYIRDVVLAPMARKDITGQSFAFTVRQGGQKVTCTEEGDRYFEDREITDIDLHDVGPVTYPQYVETDVALRTLGEAKEREFRHKSHLHLMRLKQKRSKIFTF